MSGGHYGYAFTHVSRFADDLQADIDSNHSGDIRAASSRLQRLATIAEPMAALMKAAEWYMSGDHGDESFAERFDEAMSKLQKAMIEP